MAADGDTVKVTWGSGNGYKRLADNSNAKCVQVIF